MVLANAGIIKKEHIIYQMCKNDLGDIQKLS